MTTTKDNVRSIFPAHAAHVAKREHDDAVHAVLMAAMGEARQEMKSFRSDPELDEKLNELCHMFHLPMSEMVYRLLKVLVTEKLAGDLFMDSGNVAEVVRL